MPARITRARARRHDENHPVGISKGKVDPKVKKVHRPALADRTNSASDENTSRDEPKNNLETTRPRRAQRIPARLTDHEIAVTPPKRKEAAPKKVSPSRKRGTGSPFKAPHVESVNQERPRRAVRLPSRFEDHSLSPSKFVALKPASASTPIPVKNKSKSTVVDNTSTVNKNKSIKNKNTVNENGGKTRSKKIQDKENKAADDNNNARTRNYPVKRNLERESKCQEKPKATERNKVITPKKTQPIKKRATPAITSPPLDVNTHESPKLSHSRIIKKCVSPVKKIVSPEIKEKLAIYEFTYDPKEEPKIPKRKIKKQTVRKKAAPRRVVLKDNYSRNVEKKLEHLKNLLSKKTNEAVDKIIDNPVKKIAANLVEKTTVSNDTENKNVAANNIEKTIAAEKDDNQASSASRNSTDSPPHLEIPTQYEEPPISYSPIPTSHNVPDSMNPPASTIQHLTNNRDPLNLIEELSFFDEVPVASSSIVSRRSAEASPWRVNCEFNSKWPVNMYVKPSLTPAYDSSFINVEIDSNKEKPDNCGLFQDNVETGLKQTSILSYIQEKTQKHKKKSAVTPIKNNSLFDGSHSSTSSDPNAQADMSRNKIDTSNESVVLGAINEKVDKLPVTPVKKSNPVEEKEKGANEFFGFDVSGNEDQENISPKKKTQKLLKSKRILRNRVGLSEHNHQRPMRLTTLPAKVFAPSSAVVNKLYEELKSVEETPIVPGLETDVEKSLNVDSSPDSSGEENATRNYEKSDSSVHLFEEIGIVHHNVPERKSYGKSRKVTMHQTAVATHDSCASEMSDDSDSTYTVRAVRKRHVKKRNKKQVAEEKVNEEAEAWAEEFNSMIEEAEEFPLVIE